MNNINILFWSLYVSQNFESNIGAHSVIRFNVPMAETSTDALICGVMRHNQALGVQLDTTTHECTTLPDSWFQGNVYYLQTMYEEIFEPTIDTGLLDIPGVFNTGSYIAVLFDTGELMRTTRTSIHLGVPSTSPKQFLLLSMGFRYNMNRFSYNTMKNGRFGDEERSELIVSESNTTYRIDIKMTSYEFQIAIDRKSHYNFTRRYPDKPGYFRFVSHVSTCFQVQYYFPV